MKFTTLILIISIFQIQANHFYGQPTTITLNLQNVSLEKVLNRIESLTDYNFIYMDKEVDYNEAVTIQVAKMPLEKVLDKLFSNTKINYTIKGTQIVLRPQTPPKSSENDSSFNMKNLQFQISGTVLDQDKSPLPGASIVEKGTTNGVTTDFDGNFSMKLSSGQATLEVSYLGYTTKEISVEGNQNMQIILNESSSKLDEVVVVAYGTKKKSSVTSAISTLKGNNIAHNPVANINNSIAGRISGVLAFQSSGEPGADAADLQIRGLGTIGSNSGALTIVDGVPRSYSQINPNEIESFTVLKDAAAIAPYGLAGANGVILITTKRGTADKVSLNYNTWYGVQRPTRYPEYLDSYGYASALNIANNNAGLEPAYTDEELQKYKNGDDPDHYPNHDWVKEVIDFNAPMISHNLDFSGGSDKIRFFSSLGYLYQQGSVKTINYSRYNLASNIDFNASKSTLVSLDLRGSLEVTKNPGSTNGTTLYTQVTKRPPLFNDQLSFSNGLPGNALLPSIYNSGYDNDKKNTLYSQLSIVQKIPALSGLTIKGVVSYDKDYTLNKQWQIPYVFYRLDSSDEFVEVNGGVTDPRLSQSFSERINTTLQGYITYKNSFGKHGLDALFVAEQRNGDGIDFSASRINYQVAMDELSLGSSSKTDLDNSGSSQSSKQIGLVYRLAYDYSDKYLVELAGRYDGHYYFAPDNRFAFFPSISLGWRLSEEAFIKDNITWLDNLKLRGSYGKSGNLAGGAFQYLSSYKLINSYVFGGSQVQGAAERNEPNVDITWENALKADLGIEGSFLLGRIGFELDFFKEKRSNMLVSPDAVVPIEYGIGISQVNAGKMENQGFDFSLTSKNNFSNGLIINGGFNFSYAKNKLIQTFENESTLNDLNRSRTGRSLDTHFGLRALGLFQSQEEIDGAATQFGTLQPGDIRYEDINEDGKIDNEDEVVIGNPSYPQIIYGLTTNVIWKGFDMSMLWQGAAKSNFLLTNEAANPFFNGAKIFEEQLDYWTPENRDAKYPIIMPSPTANNSQVSSWWIRDGKYVRLKNLELGFSFPSAVMEKLNMKSIRVFASGQNLLTFSSEKYLDPEIGLNGGSRRARYYFQQKVYSFGLNISF
ncbi:TonB-dependent receptor [Zobellia uliginosa]|uniref:TonB-dependent receptor n=1 Tax=Zobellia uliginosa TaxID=143224 RepID=UPI001C074465|nr:TonB-dependent receptor [Zobellia uliginosa]MBU2947361.1 TonB-dependent receptor [Zobellia uliginosa]